MSRLAVTFIDVGWGDCLFIESQVGSDPKDVRYALIDCNDKVTEKSAYLFIKKHLEKQEVVLSDRYPIFDFILLTHAHEDHYSGIQSMMSKFRTERFWYPKSDSDSAGFAKVMRYANRYTSRVASHQSISNANSLPDLGDVQVQPLWPPYSPDGAYDNNPNNTSVVLALTLGGVTFVTTGDVQAEMWSQIVGSLPATTRMMQSPHHGAKNGIFDGSATPLLDHIDASTTPIILGLSSHIRPHGHPHADVVGALESRNIEHYRTDQQYHLRFETDGTSVSVNYSHI
jgi:competence protein ComEC